MTVIPEPERAIDPPGREPGRARMPVVRVESPEDPRLTPFHAVRDPDLARRQGLFVAEGRRVLERVVAAGHYRVRSVLLSPSALEALAAAVARLPPSTEVLVADTAVVRALTGYNIHRGALALVERPVPRRWPEVLPHGDAPAVIVALEGVANPDNIGGVFRTAAAFGVAGVLLDPASSDPLYRKAVRTSMGAALTVPWARAVPWPDVLTDLRHEGWQVVGLAAGAPETLDGFCRGGRRRDRILLVVGHEGHGLRAETLARTEVTVAIPMAPGVDSLNLVVATGIALYALVGAGPLE